MASFSTTTMVDEPRISLGDDGILPPIRVGGGDDGSGPGLPDYATRLRRGRLGGVGALTPGIMLFLLFCSGYVWCHGLPTLDPPSEQPVRHWVPVTVPQTLFS